MKFPDDFFEYLNRLMIGIYFPIRNNKLYFEDHSSEEKEIFILELV
jgi:hypothetical protein